MDDDEPPAAIPAFVLGRLAVFNAAIAVVLAIVWVASGEPLSDQLALASAVYGAALTGGLWLAARWRG